MRRFIIDTDPGIDDAFAIGFMLKSDVELLGITTVSGNDGIETVTKNALRLLHFFNRSDIPVFQGAGKPMVQMSGESDGCHGADGLGNTNLPLGPCSAESEHAVDFLIERAEASSGDLEILALGPLTNLAIAIQRAPETMRKIKTIHSMGGGVLKGNMNAVSEFNYWVDPEAADIVYRSGIPIRMVGLNATEQCIFTPNDFYLLRNRRDNVSQLYDQMQNHSTSYYWQQAGIRGALIHDLVTAVSALDEKSVSFVPAHVDIAFGELTRGQTLVDLVDAWGEEKNAEVAVKVDENRMKQHVFSTLFGIDAHHAII